MIVRRVLVFSVAVVATVLAAAGLLCWDSARAAEPPVFTGLVKGVAVGGYDPVAYFSDKKPVKGSPQITLQHEGVTWRFASEANRTVFQAEPSKYAPQYGGYCAYAVAHDYTAKGDPEAWSVVNGKLYLNYNKSVRKDWEKNIPSYIEKGDANWPKVLGKK